jgi:hypothetical protein
VRLSLITEDKIYGQHIVKVMYNKIYPTIYIEERKCKVEEEQYIYFIVYVMYIVSKRIQTDVYHT